MTSTKSEIAMATHEDRSIDTEVDGIKNDGSLPFTDLQTRALVRKLDWNLIPFLSLLYLLSFLDRTNIGNAKLFRLEKDLGLIDNQYNIALSVFFVTYVIFEVPSNMVLKKWRPSMWFPIIMLAWGLIMTLTGFVTNLTGLTIARLFLGVAESGLFPGVAYYITSWYPRRECAFRTSIFFSAATVAGAFGGLLARAIIGMDGAGGKPGWAWIFILEGLMTVIIAVAAFWVITDKPETATFLSGAEVKEVQRRLTQDNDGLADRFDIQFVLDALMDWKIWLQCLAYIGVVCPLYTISLFLPSILAAMGFTAATSQLLTVPPYILAGICTVLGGYYSDKTGKRAVFLIGFCAIGMVGYIFLISSSIPAAQYIGTFLAACGVYPMVPIIIMWNGNNIGGSTKRGVGLAMQIAFGNCGGVISSYIYRNQDSPRYFVGHGIVLCFLAMALILYIIQIIVLKAINRQRDQDYGNPSEYSPEHKLTEMDKGDNARYFRYTI